MQLRTVATLVGVAIIAATLARSTAARAAVPSVPASIAADCSRDVTSELNAWIRSVPDGSTLTFGAGACYRIDKTLDVVDRTGLTFDGNSSTFKATTQGDSGRAQWHAEGGGNLTFKAMTVQGVNTNGEWNSAYEWQHNFSIAGVQGMVLDSVTAKYSHGDWVAVNPDRRNEGTDPGRAIPGRNVRITNSSFINAGRQGISCTHCDGLTIEGNYLNGTGQSMFDLEVEGDQWYLKNVYIRRNRTGRISHLLVANAGNGVSLQDNVNITDNVMEQAQESCYSNIDVVASMAGKRTNYTIARNTLRTDTSAATFQNVSGITVQDNTIIGTSGGCTSGEGDGVTSISSHDGTVRGNNFEGDLTNSAAIDSASTNWRVCGNRNGRRSDLPAPCADASTVRAIDRACPPDRVTEDGFADVPSTSTHEFPIDCVVWRRIGSGTSASTYHPERGVTRAQLAALIARLIRTSGGHLPADPPDRFVDDENSVHEDHINALAAIGLVAGRTSDRYAPSETVTRGQMATFLIHAYEYRSGATLANNGDWFTDDETSPHKDNINKAASAGLTGGTASGSYTPSGPVTRGQMASFLARVLDLLIENGHASG